ncbi:MAG: hypothetical protein PHX27_01800 [Candidatus ainarchaeum sp.]|nr:hypothetical protein [Candidatus ainarchaeum sp.]
MSILEENVKLTIQKINSLHDSINISNWGELRREGFVFELEQSTQKMKEILDLLKQVNKETILLLEKNTPDINDFLEKFEKNIIVFESNIKMERTKRMRVELINENEMMDVPELYRTLQNKILELSLQARYEIEKINKFLIIKKTPFLQKGSTAKSLLEILQKREGEIEDIRKKNFELKRQSFFKANEVSVAEIEEELHEKDKLLDEAVKEAKKSLKTHLAQINYVQGSFLTIEKKVSLIDTIHSDFVKKTINLIKELKKERDYARKIAIEIEEDTLRIRQEQTRQIMQISEEKNDIKEKIENKYLNNIKKLRQENDDKHLALTNMQKLIESQEKEIKILKETINQKIKETDNEKTRTELFYQKEEKQKK